MKTEQKYRRVPNTFAFDFAMAEKFGADGIADTYARAKHAWKENVEHYTELVIVLNRLCWLHFYNGNTELSKLYGELYHDANRCAYDFFSDDAIDYYFETID